jgi:hypothetical protein
MLTGILLLGHSSEFCFTRLTAPGRVESLAAMKIVVIQCLLTGPHRNFIF